MLNRNLKYNIIDSLDVKTKDGKDVHIKYDIKAKAYMNLFKWLSMPKVDKELNKIGLKETLKYFMSGNISFLLRETYLDDIDSFKFSLSANLSNLLNKRNDRFKFKLLKIKNISINLNGLDDKLTDKRKERNKYLDELLG